MEFIPLTVCLCNTCKWCVWAVNEDDDDIYLCVNKEVTGGNFMIADRFVCDGYVESSSSD